RPSPPTWPGLAVPSTRSFRAEGVTGVAFGAGGVSPEPQAPHESRAPHGATGEGGEGGSSSGERACRPGGGDRTGRPPGAVPFRWSGGGREAAGRAARRPSAADGAHRAVGLEEGGVVDVVARLLAGQAG